IPKNERRERCFGRPMIGRWLFGPSFFARKIARRLIMISPPPASAIAMPKPIATQFQALSASTSPSQVEEEAGLPRPDPVEAGPAEERSGDHEHGPEHDEHRERHDGELPTVGEHRRVLVGVW